MNIFSHFNDDDQGISRAGVILLLPFILLVTAYAVYKLFLIADPVVSGMEEFRFLPAEKTLHINGEHLKSISIHIMQEDQVKEILMDKPETGDKSYALTIKPRDLGLSDGAAKVFVHAKSGLLKEIKQAMDIQIDTVPPSLEVVRAPFQIYQGSGGFALLRAKDADSVFIKLDDIEFPAFRKSSGEEMQKPSSGDFNYDPLIASTKKNTLAADYFAFFAAPFEVTEGKTFYAIALDKAGNRSVRSLRTQLKTKKFRKSSISISDDFINAVVVPLLNTPDIQDPASAFKKVNEDWRRAALLELAKLTKQTEPSMLWKGRFLQLKNSKVMAEYGDIRTYTYRGKAISNSAHLGYDLASHANAPVGAANAGIVRFAANLSIYGETVIIDHGMGLMTLYGHLAAITVEEGQQVSKGDIIGKSGSTGLAGGDHLHFGVVIHGYEISPLHWWDPRWVKVNIEDHVQL